MTIAERISSGSVVVGVNFIIAAAIVTIFTGVKRIRGDRWVFMTLALSFIIWGSLWSNTYDGPPKWWWPVRAGVTLNLLLAFTSYFPKAYSFIFRPLLKVFSDKVHAILTWYVIVFGNAFFYIYDMTVDAWQTYIKHEYPDFVSFLHQIFR